jgi:hypothetical protein
MCSGASYCPCGVQCFAPEKLGTCKSILSASAP